MRYILRAFGSKVVSTWIMLSIVILTIIMMFVNNQLREIDIYIMIALCLIICIAGCFLLKWKIIFLDESFVIPFAHNEEGVIEKNLNIEYSNCATFKYINKSSEGCILNGSKKSVDTLIVVLKSGTIYKMELTFFSKKQVDTILKLLKEKITNVTSNYNEGEL